MLEWLFSLMIVRYCYCTVTVTVGLFSDENAAMDDSHRSPTPSGDTGRVPDDVVTFEWRQEVQRGSLPVSFSLYADSVVIL